MKNKLVLLGLVALIFASCSQHPAATPGNTFKISGTLKGLGNDTVWLLVRTDQGTVTDTGIARKDEFSFTGQCPEPQLYTLVWYHKAQKMHKEIFVENTAIMLSGPYDSAELVTISGSSPQKKYDEYLGLVKQVEDKIDAVENQEQPLDAQKDKALIASLDSSIDLLDRDKKEIAKKYIAGNTGSIVAPLVALRNFGIEPKLEEIEPIAKSMDTTAMSSYYGKQLSDLVKALKVTAIGAEAPDFTLSDTSGNPVSLSSYRGKLVLVDFWASWCGPCRRENPNVVKAYAKFHPKGLEILGVSLDQKHDKWVAAIEKDNLSWQHVSDLKGWGNVVGKQYAVRAIPGNFLIDKDGKIIAKNLHGDDLDKKLAEVLE